jgi:hypothetical protein
MRLVYKSVSQTMVRGPQVVLEVCPCGPSKKDKRKTNINFFYKFKVIQILMASNY